MEDLTIHHDPDLQRFTTTVDGHQALLEYRPVSEGVVDYWRTYVPPEIRGRGVALRLTRHALAHAATEQLEVIPSCWFVAKVVNTRATD